MPFAKHLYIKKGLEFNIPHDILFKNASILEKIADSGSFPLLTLNNLSVVTGVSYSILHKIVGAQATDSSYDTKRIKKSNGQDRVIHAPKPEIKYLQRWILENILNARKVSSSSFAFEKYKNVYQAMERHSGATYFFKIDLKDFFPSISDRHIYKIFREIGYPALLSFELARICTIPLPELKSTERRLKNKNLPYPNQILRRGLPQGAPTSGFLANLACENLDHSLGTYAFKESLVYTRYADDLLFSSCENLDKSRISQHIKEINQIIQKSGLDVNYSKIRVYSPGSTKRGLGLIVTSEGPKVPKKYIEETRRKIRYSLKNGISTQAEREGFRSPKNYMNHIDGRISYIKLTNSNKYKKLYQEWSKVKSTYYLNIAESDSIW